MDHLNKIKDQGYRLTSPRKMVLSRLSQSPVTISEIFQNLQNQNVKIDLVSIYRTLDLFLKLRLVAEIDFGDGKKRYELIDDKNHHHHLVCDHCGKVEDIRLSIEDKMIKDVKSKSNFKVERHSLELFGLCANCQ